MAFDFPNNGVYVRVNAGNWNNNVANNPDTNTGAVTMTGLAAGPYYPAYGTVGFTTSSIQINPGGAFINTKPATYDSWDINQFNRWPQLAPILAQ